MKKYILQIKDLCKSFNTKKVLDNLSLKVQEGQLYGFLGVNGAGKSTTLNILLGLLSKDSGHIEIDGEVIDASNDFESIKQKIGVVFQDSILDDNLSVYQNLLLRASLYHKKFKDVKPKELLNDVVEKFRLNDLLKNKYKSLSGGQKRRVDIARALLHRPKILFLDEPTTGLDPQSRKLVWDTLLELKNRIELSIILTTHYMEEANNCDYAIIIDKGVKLAQGTPTELKRFSHTKIYEYTQKSVLLEKICTDENIEFVYENNCYTLIFKTYIEAKNFIIKHPDALVNFELKKGTMDDVFLNLTKGKENINV